MVGEQSNSGPLRDRYGVVETPGGEATAPECAVLPLSACGFFQHPALDRLYEVVHPLLVACRQVLEEPTSTTAMKTVAGSALLAAFDEDLGLPVAYVRAVWSFLRISTATYFNTEKVAEVADDSIRAEAVEMLREPNTGNSERRLAVQVLSGSGHARYLDDHTLLDLVERTRTGGYALDVAGLVVAVHKARGIPAEVLVAIRDRWSRGSIGMKEAAITVGSELSEVDLTWTRRLLEDPEPDVRACLVYQLEREGRPCEGLAKLLDDRLRLETSPDVRAALYRAVAALDGVDHDRNRRRRGRERLRQEAR